VIHVQKQCPDCSRIYNHPTDRQCYREDVTVKTEIMDYVCGKCEEGVEDRDTPL